MSYQDQSFYQSQFPTYNPAAALGGTHDISSQHQVPSADDHYQSHYNSGHARVPAHDINNQALYNNNVQMLNNLDSTSTMQYDQQTYNYNVGVGSSLGTANHNQVTSRSGRSMNSQDQVYYNDYDAQEEQLLNHNQTLGQANGDMGTSGNYQGNVPFYPQSEEVLLNQRRDKRYGRDRVGYCDECIGGGDICLLIFVMLFVIGFIICFAYLMSILK